MVNGRTVALLLGLALAGLALAAELPMQSAVPGGVVLVPLGPANAPVPLADYEGNRVMVLENGGQWLAVVGVSLEASPGHHTLRVTNPDGQSHSLVFLVGPKEYTTQHLVLKDKRMVTPAEKDLARINDEWKRSRAAYRSWSEVSDEPFPLDLPVEGRRSSSFGLRRVFNGEPRRPHAGMDIAAPAGAPIRTPAPGRVVEAGEFYFNGKTLFVDHGQGLVTMYAHLSRIDVAVGQQLGRGEIIGAVGATGRATGPHLHWTVSLNGVAVDPALLLADVLPALATAGEGGPQMNATGRK